MVTAFSVFTENGRKALGRTIRFARELKGWSLDDLVDRIFSETGFFKTTKGTLSNLERGITRPNPDLLAAIAAVGFVPHPTDDRPFTTEEFFDIARELLDPETGERKQNSHNGH